MKRKILFTLISLIFVFSPTIMQLLLLLLLSPRSLTERITTCVLLALIVPIQILFACSWNKSLKSFYLMIDNNDKLKAFS